MSIEAVAYVPGVHYRRPIPCKSCGADIFYIKTRSLCVTCHKGRMNSHAKGGVVTSNKPISSLDYVPFIDKVKDSYCPAAAWTRAHDKVKAHNRIIEGRLG
jgi:hypothetical protein